MSVSAPAKRPVNSAICEPVPSEPLEDQGYSVQQAARLTGLSEHTLRYYERAGLLQPVRRQASSRHRRYTADDIARLSTLACLRAAGMPLDQMRRYFELLQQGASAAPLQHAMLADQRKVLEERLGQLQQHIAYLDRKIAYFEAVEAGDTARAAEIVEHFFHSLRQS
jgi:MerR family transcriptional regulator, aldehyde-responsive regulator